VTVLDDGVIAVCRSRDDGLGWRWRFRRGESPLSERHRPKGIRKRQVLSFGLQLVRS
jgi:hypothetical protein